MCVAAPVSGVCAHVNDQTACLTRSERKRDKEHTSSGERVKLLGGGATTLIMIKRLKHTHSCEHLCPLTPCSGT